MHTNFAPECEAGAPCPHWTRQLAPWTQIRLFLIARPLFCWSGMWLCALCSFRWRMWNFTVFYFVVFKCCSDFAARFVWFPLERAWGPGSSAHGSTWTSAQPTRPWRKPGGESESVVQEAIDRMIAQGNMTVVVIAHRCAPQRSLTPIALLYIVF